MKKKENIEENSLRTLNELCTWMPELWHTPQSLAQREKNEIPRLNLVEVIADTTKPNIFYNLSISFWTTVNRFAIQSFQIIPMLYFFYSHKTIFNGECPFVSLVLRNLPHFRQSFEVLTMSAMQSELKPFLSTLSCNCDGYWEEPLK